MLAAPFEDAAPARDFERMAAALLGGAQALVVVLDELASPADVSVRRHDEVLDAVQPADAVSGIDACGELEEGLPAALVEAAVDGLLEEPEISGQEAVAVVGPAQDVEGSVDIGDVAGHGVSTDLLRENR